MGLFLLMLIILALLFLVLDLERSGVEYSGKMMMRIRMRQKLTCLYISRLSCSIRFAYFAPTIFAAVVNGQH